MNDQGPRKGRILIVEDEESLREAIRFNLDLEGYQTVIARDGQEAIEKFRERSFELIILDIMLPRVDGFAVCQQIRAENDKTPIIFLTARNTDAERVKGLKLGGDDYVGKPFDLEELLLRVGKLIARHQPSSSGKDMKEYAFGPNHVNFLTYEVNGVSGRKSLTKREIMLLKLLIDRANEVVSREEILDTVWGYDAYPSPRTIDNFILHFRKCFEKDPRHPDYFHSVRGVGYRFTPRDDDAPA